MLRRASQSIGYMLNRFRMFFICFGDFLQNQVQIEVRLEELEALLQTQQQQLLHQQQQQQQQQNRHRQTPDALHEPVHAVPGLFLRLHCRMSCRTSRACL